MCSGSFDVYKAIFDLTRDSGNDNFDEFYFIRYDVGIYNNTIY